MERIIVRNGRFQIFGILRRTFGRDTNIEIMWDRRRTQARERRDAGDADRRGRPAFEWDRLDYIFASGMRPETGVGKVRRS